MKKKAYPYLDLRFQQLGIHSIAEISTHVKSFPSIPNSTYNDFDFA